MAEMPERPLYTAAVFSPIGEDLGSIYLADAKDDDQAGTLVMGRAAEWMARHGVDRATVQIVKDGVGMRSIPVEYNK
jgi:hypothetical protein